MTPFIPPDHSLGDDTTVGGYTAVHSRPPGLQGKDGRAYTVELAVDDTDDVAQPFGGYLFFVQWSAGDPRPSGHLETDFVVRAPSEDGALKALGALPLTEVQRLLDALIAAKSPGPTRPWWDAMRDEGDDV
jgi:hypothetical protein